ncbi:MAG: hypothetical protein ACPG47_01045 [Leucothrix sp.]
MLQEIVEGKWIASFVRVFTLNGIEKGTNVAIVAESQSRPVLIKLAELACYQLGAEFATITLPSPEVSSPVPVRSTGASEAIQQKPFVIEALKQVEVVVDLTVEGLLHAEELEAIQSEGARLLVVCNEHPEVLERCEPKAEDGPKVRAGIKMLYKANTMRVSSAAGTDLTIDVSDAPCGGTAGFSTAKSGVSHWPGGLCLCFPGKNTVNGTIVMNRGDLNLTFKEYVREPITLTVENDFIVDIAGDNLDAALFRSYLDAWNDPGAYGFSHVGWGMNTAARWESLAMYDKGDLQATELRAFAGNFLFSTGSNQYANRFTAAHFDLPMRACTIALDGNIIVDAGVLQGELA